MDMINELINELFNELLASEYGKYAAALVFVCCMLMRRYRKSGNATNADKEVVTGKSKK